MNCKSGEFKHWDKEICKCFSKALIEFLARRKMGAIAIACDMSAISSVFPNGDPTYLKRRTYTLCMKAVMVRLAECMESSFPATAFL